MQIRGKDVTPIPLMDVGFNPNAEIPYGVTSDHIKKSLSDWIDFLTFMNEQLFVKQIPRLETFIMPASFSSMVGEFMNMRIPLYCPLIVRNKYHNGHPDLIPAGQFDHDSVQHSTIGIEIKGSRNRKGWQGHNPENIWLMVFIFDANSANDEARSLRKKTEPESKPFRFVEVLGAQLEEDDWQFSGRSETSRRTITATIKPSGYEKMADNWIYRDPAFTRLRSRSYQ